MQISIYLFVRVSFLASTKCRKYDIMKKMFIAIWVVLVLMVVIAASCSKQSVATPLVASEEKTFIITSLDGREIGNIVLGKMPDGNANIVVSMKGTAVEGFDYVQPVLTRSVNENTREVFSVLDRIDKTDLVSENNPVKATNGQPVSYDALKFTRVLTLRLDVGGTNQSFAELRLQQ